MLGQKPATRVQELALCVYWHDSRILANNSLPQKALDELLEPLHSLYLECVTFDWDTIRRRSLVELQLHRLNRDMSPSSSQLVSFLNANPMIRKLNISDVYLSIPEPSLPSIKLLELQHLELLTWVGLTKWFLTLLQRFPKRHALGALNLINPPLL